MLFLFREKDDNKLEKIVEMFWNRLETEISKVNSIKEYQLYSNEMSDYRFTCETSIGENNFLLTFTDCNNARQIDVKVKIIN